tara:strand:- start:458 stop:898 length:441 start_codon:yes stop_codon:yes gene_type:complete
MSNLWGRYNLTFKNVDIRKSSPPTSTPRASTTLLPQISNPVRSMGNSVDGYRAPVQIINVLPPMYPPKVRESNQMNPLEQKEKNIMMERMAVPDPRMDVTGSHVPTDEKLENMNIQVPPFNYNGIMGVVGILIGIVAIVWLARGRK